jgi:hypothetical protein
MIAIIDQLIRLTESYVIGEEKYSNKIDELISDLVKVKDSLKKGSNKKFYRKEASRIQSAIQTLRYLKKKSERKMMKKDKVIISESELIQLFKSKNLTIEATRTDSTFLGGVQNLINAKNIFYGLYKDTTSSMNDKGTADTVMESIKDDIEAIHSDRINTYREQPVKLDGIVSPAAVDVLTVITKPFSNFIFGGLFNLIRTILATYDDGGTGDFASIPTQYPGEKQEYVSDKSRNPLKLGNINKIKSGAVVVPINAITKGLNKLLLSISDVPEEATYTDSKYTARQIANDIGNIFNIPGNQVKINTENIQRIIETNIYEKQYNALSLSGDNVALATGSMQALAASIGIQLVDYIIEGLTESSNTIRIVLQEMSRKVEYTSSGRDVFISTDILETIEPIKTLEHSLRSSVRGNIKN